MGTCSIQTVGIIAEYNPFHKGHLYQIEEIKRQTGAKNIVVVMSGNFLQRGTPAFIEKSLRTKMALSCGVSLVFELPVSYATASAEYFALGGISLLHRLGFIDAVCFGSECGNISALSAIADILLNEPRELSSLLQKYLTLGMTYPQARTLAIKELFPDLLTQYPDLLTTPNNILGIEYLKALKRLNSPMMPLTIKRTDGGYHSTEEKSGLLSATGIRKELDHWEEHPIDPLPCKDTLPTSVYRLLEKARNQFPLCENDFSSLMYYRLRTLAEDDFSIFDMTPELYHRIRQELPNYTTLSDFILRLKTKQYTHSRISRVLCHLLLHIKKPDNIYYARLLGFHKESSPLLRQVTDLPIITKTADARNRLQDFYAETNTFQYAWSQFETDVLASDIYRHTLLEKKNVLLPDEFRSPVIRYPLS